MANANRVDPYRNFNFLVEIDGVTQAGFAECSGFGASNDADRVSRGRRTHRPCASCPG